jgi:hypothetical protein
VAPLADTNISIKKSNSNSKANSKKGRFNGSRFKVQGMTGPGIVFMFRF